MHARAATPLALLTLGCAFAGCAQILGYDDLSPASADASTDAQADVATDASADAVDPRDALDALDAAGSGADHPAQRPVGLPQLASGTGKTLTFAVKHAYLGTQTHLNETATDAWREWGYDLDGLCTDAVASNGSIGTCTRAEGSDPSVMVDGDRCRDNNFGSRVAALVMTYQSTWETSTNDLILKGSRSLAFVLSDVDDGPDDGFAPGALYRLASVGSNPAPKWDGTDVRQVSDDSVQDLDLSKPVVSFPKGYIVGNVWISGEPSDFPLAVGITGGQTLVLPLKSGRVTIPLDDAHAKSPKPALIVGAVFAPDLQDAVKPVAQAAGLCPTGTTKPFYDGLIGTLLSYVDVVIGAPNLQDASKPCDGISTALGWELAPIMPLATIVPAKTPPASPCP